VPGQLGGLLVGRRRRGVGEEGDVGAPLAEQQRLVHRPRTGGQHPDGLVADLPAVAVGAVQVDELVGAPPTGAEAVEFLSLFGSQGERVRLRTRPQAKQPTG
jgi:hypothetical protein